MGRDFLMDYDGEWERDRMKMERASTRAQMLRAGVKPGDRCLDVGSDSGVSTIELARLAAPATVVGVDLSEARVERATELARAEGVDNVSFRIGDAYEMPFEDDTFDFVWNRFLLEYLKEPKRAIVEMKRVSRAGGRVVSADLDGNCLFHYPISQSLETELQRVLELLSGEGFDAFVGRKIFHFYREAQLTDLSVWLEAHHLIAGEPTSQERAAWREKLAAVEAILAPHYPDRDRLARFVREFRDVIEDPDTFTYGPLIIVTGVK